MINNLSPNAESKKYLKNFKYNQNDEYMKYTSIILVTYNQLKYTQICIESIRKFTAKDGYEIIIIDNASTDETVKWIKKQDDIILIENKKNEGFPVACNQGIKIARGDSILLLNNDTIVTPNWLNNLNRALYSNDEIAGVGAITNSCSNNQQVDINYTDIAEMINFATFINKSSKDSWEYRIRLIGFCYLFKKSIFNKVGLLDEQFTPGNFEDDDISYRIISAGYKLLLCKDVFIHHFGGVSFGRAENFIEVNSINERKFYEKWGFNTRYSAIVRNDVINLIDTNRKDKLNVLEIGCGVGATLLELKNKFESVNLYGIEVSEGAGFVASGICNLIVGNIENIRLPYEEKIFDYIIVADVLEHLINPWKVLEMLKRYLKNSGEIIASIPNLMHITVMKNLLAGRFRYEEAGILDKTHLRFFTLFEINEMFINTNYTIESINGIAFELTNEDETFINELSKLNDEDIKQQFKIYQYIIKAKLNLIEDSKDLESQLLQKLKVKLLRLDNNIDIEESLNFIMDNYNENKKNIVSYIKNLIELEVINKKEVIEYLIEEAEKRQLYEFLNHLKGEV